MFDINEADDFIASNRLTHGRRPENGPRVYESIEAAFASMARHI